MTTPHEQLTKLRAQNAARQARYRRAHGPEVIRAADARRRAAVKELRERYREEYAELIAVERASSPQTPPWPKATRALRDNHRVEYEAVMKP